MNHGVALQSLLVAVAADFAVQDISKDAQIRILSRHIKILKQNLRLVEPVWCLKNKTCKYIYLQVERRRRDSNPRAPEG